MAIAATVPRHRVAMSERPTCRAVGSSRRGPTRVAMSERSTPRAVGSSRWWVRACGRGRGSGRAPRRAPRRSARPSRRCRATAKIGTSSGSPATQLSEPRAKSTFGCVGIVRSDLGEHDVDHVEPDVVGRRRSAATAHVSSSGAKRGSLWRYTLWPKPGMWRRSARARATTVAGSSRMHSSRKRCTARHRRTVEGALDGRQARRRSRCTATRGPKRRRGRRACSWRVRGRRAGRARCRWRRRAPALGRVIQTPSETIARTVR